MADPAHPSFDAYAPKEMAHRVETAGIAKTKLDLTKTLMLGFLAGAFIAFGAMFCTLTITGSPFGFGPTRALGGLVFSLGLILVVVGGAELFTGNNIVVMAWAARHVTLAAMLRNWTLVFIGNAAGAVAMAVAVKFAGALDIGGGQVAETAVKIALGKVHLTPVEAFFRGILCNALVCLAVWLCFAAHSVSGKILAIVFPISAFVALGFEHSIANLYLIPVAMLTATGDAQMALTMPALIGNLVPVTLGNIVGGAGFVALTYWAIYLRD